MSGSTSYTIPGVFSSVASVFSSATGKRKKNPSSVKNSSQLKNYGCGCLGGLQKTIKKQLQKCWKPNTVNVVPASVRAQQNWQQSEQSETESLSPLPPLSSFESVSTQRMEEQEQISEEHISRHDYTLTPSPERTLRQKYLHNIHNSSNDFPNDSGLPLSATIPGSSIVYRPATQHLGSTTHEIESAHSDSSTPIQSAGKRPALLPDSVINDSNRSPLSAMIPGSSIVYRPATQHLESTTHEIESVHSDPSTSIKSADKRPALLPELPPALLIEWQADFELSKNRFRAFADANNEADHLLRQYAGLVNKYESLCNALEKAGKKEKVSCFSFMRQKTPSKQQQKLEATREKTGGRLASQWKKLDTLLNRLDELAEVAFYEPEFPFLRNPEKTAEAKAQISQSREQALAELARPKDIKEMVAFIKRFKDAELIEQLKLNQHPAIDIDPNRDFEEQIEEPRAELQKDIDAQIAACPGEELPKRLTDLVEKELSRHIDYLDHLPKLLDATLESIEGNKARSRKIRERLMRDQSVPAIAAVRTNLSPITKELTSANDKLEWIEKLKNETQEQESHYRKQWIDLKLQKLDLKLPELKISSEDSTLLEQEIKEKLKEVKPNLQRLRNHFYYLDGIEKEIRDREAQSQQYLAEGAA